MAGNPHATHRAGLEFRKALGTQDRMRARFNYNVGFGRETAYALRLFIYSEAKFCELLFSDRLLRLHDLFV